MVYSIPARSGHRAHGKISLVIALTINGERRDFEGPLTAAELIERLQLSGKRVALERNGQIVPRGTFPHERLAHGDRLEIVVAVGGG